MCVTNFHKCHGNYENGPGAVEQDNAISGDSHSPLSQALSLLLCPTSAGLLVQSDRVYPLSVFDLLFHFQRVYKHTSHRLRLSLKGATWLPASCRVLLLLHLVPLEIERERPSRRSVLRVIDPNGTGRHIALGSRFISVYRDCGQ